MLRTANGMCAPLIFVLILSFTPPDFGNASGPPWSKRDMSSQRSLRIDWGGLCDYPNGSLGLRLPGFVGPGLELSKPFGMLMDADHIWLLIWLVNMVSCLLLGSACAISVET